MPRGGRTQNKDTTISFCVKKSNNVLDAKKKNKIVCNRDKPLLETNEVCKH